MPEPTLLDQAISLGIVLLVIVSLIVIWRMNRKFGGRLRTTLTFFSAGIVIFLFTAFFGPLINIRVSLLGSSFGLHDFLILVALFLFLTAARKFSQLLSQEFYRENVGR